VGSPRRQSRSGLPGPWSQTALPAPHGTAQQSGHLACRWLAQGEQSRAQRQTSGWVMRNDAVLAHARSPSTCGGAAKNHVVSSASCPTREPCSARSAPHPRPWHDHPSTSKNGNCRSRSPSAPCDSSSAARRTQAQRTGTRPRARLRADIFKFVVETLTGDVRGKIFVFFSSCSTEFGVGPVTRDPGERAGERGRERGGAGAQTR
jgi:hypothetical protein